MVWKTSPCLVPYDELPDSEKEYDMKNKDRSQAKRGSYQ